MIESIKEKIGQVVTSTYLKAVSKCETPDDLIEPSKALIAQVIALVLPTMHVRYMPNDCDAPQDMVDEESKDDFPFDLKISRQVSLLKSTISKRSA